MKNFCSDKMPIIKDNVYIGTGAKILGDVTVGSNTVVGANTVVIRDVPDNMVAYGIPARVSTRLRKCSRE